MAATLDAEWVRRILHDDIGQTLTAVGVELDLIRMDFGGQAPGLEARLSSVQAGLEKAFEDLRELSRRLSAGPGSAR